MNWFTPTFLTQQINPLTEQIIDQIIDVRYKALALNESLVRNAEVEIAEMQEKVNYESCKASSLQGSLNNLKAEYAEIELQLEDSRAKHLTETYKRRKYVDI